MLRRSLIVKIRFGIFGAAAVLCGLFCREAAVALVPLFFWAACPCCGPAVKAGSWCPSCLSDTTPLQMQVRIAGITGTSGACNCSADLNATYVLDLDGGSQCGLSANGFCHYSYDINPDLTDCVVTAIHLAFQSIAGGSGSATGAIVAYCQTVLNYVWDGQIGPDNNPIDCRTGATLADDGSHIACNTTSSTAVIGAI